MFLWVVEQFPVYTGVMEQVTELILMKWTLSCKQINLQENIEYTWFSISSYKDWLDENDFSSQF